MNLFQKKIISVSVKILRLLKLNHYWEFVKGKSKKDKYYEYKNIKKIFFLMTPTYGNVGDQAIEIATTEYLKYYFKSHVVIKVHLEDIYMEMSAIQNVLSKEDFIVLQGGGNFGDLYLECEKARRFIVKMNPTVKIVSFPSTITYTNSKKGKRELKKSQKIYNKNSKFLIIARENYSYDFAKQNFANCQVVMNPDIVLYLNRYNKEIKRTEITVCLRQDEEGLLGDKRDKIINRLYNDYADDLNIIDTQLFRDINDLVKEAEFNSMIRQFQKSKIVITDRLHGFIFSLITKTPCIIFPTLDNKIIGTYELVKEYVQVRYIEAEEIEHITEIVKDEIQISDSTCSNLGDISFYYKELKEIINELE